MNYAIIENEVVTNIVVAGEEYALEQGWVLLEEGFGIGDSYINGEFIKDEPIEPLPQVPNSVSRAQGKAALIYGGLWTRITTFVNEIEDDTERLIAETALYDTQEWRRDSPFLTHCAQALGLTEEMLDDLFITAELVQL